MCGGGGGCGDRWPHWAIFLILSCIVSLCSGSDYCKHYVTCQQRLELEERQCVKLDKIGNLDHSGAHCLRSIDVAHAAIDGLQLRKTELEKDCAMKNVVAESTSLTYFQRIHCERAIQRLLSEMSVSEFIHKFNKLSTKIGQHNGIKACRKSTKLLHKQCHTLSHCCPLHSCPGVETIESQISSAIEYLRHLKSKCPKVKKPEYRRQM